MPIPILGTRARGALIVLAVFCMGASPAPSLPPPVAADVQESYRLLMTSAYRPVSPETLLAAASDALSEQARKEGTSIAPPSLQVQGDNDATMAELEDAIASSAAAGHGNATVYAYAAIAAMTRSQNP